MGRILASESVVPKNLSVFFVIFVTFVVHDLICNVLSVSVVHVRTGINERMA